MSLFSDLLTVVNLCNEVPTGEAVTSLCLLHLGTVDNPLTVGSYKINNNI